MMRPGQFAAVLGFAFVAMWIAVDFGAAVLCLVGALVFYLGAALMLGQLDLVELQSRVRSGFGQPAPPPPPAPPPRVR
jgi:hypothetical protein